VNSVVFVANQGAIAMEYAQIPGKAKVIISKMIDCSYKLMKTLYFPT
jgi:hypothetical protein